MRSQPTVPGTRGSAARFTKATVGALPAVALLLAGFLSSPAQAAATLSVHPLKLRLAPSRLADTVTLGNDGPRPVTVEARLFDWRYEALSDGSGDQREVLTPTTDLLATPPVFTLPPGGSRVVRVGRLAGGDPPPVERGYRLELAEVPDEAARPPGGGAQTVLTLSLPVFVAPPDRKAAPKLTAHWQPARGADDDARLRLVNEGALHARLTSARLVQDGRSCAEKTFGAYVLPGGERVLRWPGVSSCSGREAELQLDFETAPRRLGLTVPLRGDGGP